MGLDAEKHKPLCATQGSVTTQALPTETKTVEGQPVRVALRRATGSAPTALFLHGYPDTLHVFTRAIRALPSDWGYVAADFPGQGRSGPSASSTPTTSPEGRARWLAALLDVGMLRQVRVFGHDMGGHAALELARQAPKRVERLVLCHSLLDDAAPVPATIKWLRLAGAYRPLLSNLPGTVLRRCVRDFLPPNDPLTMPIEIDFGQCFDRQVGKHTAAVCDAASDWLKKGLVAYRTLEMPVVSLVGTRNLYFGREHAEALKRVVPKAEIVTVKDAWHWLAWQKPEAVVAALSGA